MEERRPSRYEEAAARIVGLIEKGAFRPGERIPSIRELAESLKISANTVREAYALLEKKRYIEASPQSGYFVLDRKIFRHQARGARSRDDGSDQVSLCRIYSAIQERGSCDEDACGLAVATLSSDMWPAEKLNKCTIDAIRLHERECLHYQLVPGFPLLREQIAVHGLSGGSRLSPDQIIVTSGCQESIYLALSCLTSAGDTVAVESPIYFNLLKLMESLKLKILEIPCSPNTGMHLETLRFALDQYPVKAVLTIANFHNPTGSLMSDERKDELVRMLSARGIPLIEDDIYGDLAFGPDRPRTCQSFDTDGTVLYCSSVSKTISPGLRIGWIAPGRWYSAIENLKTLINLGASSVPQISTALFLQDGGFNRYLRRTRLVLKDKLSAMRASVLGHFPEGTTVTDPAGGMVLWVSLPDGIDSRELYRRARERDMLIAIGPLFSLQDRFAGDFRLNGGVWSARTDDKIALLGEFAREQLAGSSAKSASTREVV